MAVIALYDSGIGGIPVLSALVRALPYETFLFYGDNLNMPYGNKTREELCNIASYNLDYLAGFAPDVLLFACNTLSTALPKGVLSRCPFPVVGLKPPFPHEKKEKTGRKNIKVLSDGGKVASVNTKKRTPGIYGGNALSDCLLLATPLTAESPYVERARRRGLRVIAAEKLAENVERFYYDEDSLRWEKILRPLDLSSVKTLYLGCTHYLWLEPYLRRKYPGLQIEDGVSGAIKRVKTALKKQGVPFTPVKFGEQTDKNEDYGVFSSRAVRSGDEREENSSKKQVRKIENFSQSTNGFSAAAPGTKKFFFRKTGNGAELSIAAKTAGGTMVHFIGECSVQNQNAYLFFNKQTFEKVVF